MKQVCGAVCIGLMMLAAMPAASAQVVVNQQALRQLAGKPPAPAPHRRVIVHRPIRHFVRRRVVLRPLPLPPPPEPRMAAVPPPAPKPAPKPVPPPAVTLVFAAPGEAILDHGQSGALATFIGKAPNRAAHFIIQATAPGVAGDPSVARRRALDRGLAVRAVLRKAGIKADHIIVQALGDPPGVPTNHVTLTEMP